MSGTRCRTAGKLTCLGLSSSIYKTGKTKQKTTENLLCTKTTLRTVNTNSFKSHNDSVYTPISSSSYRWGNWGTEKLSGLTKVHTGGMDVKQSGSKSQPLILCSEMYSISSTSTILYTLHWLLSITLSGNYYYYTHLQMRGKLA